jgi:phosphomannomutase/phosphoglucomutase
LPRYAASPEIFIKSTDEEKFKKIAELVRYVKDKKYAVVAVDGARIEFLNGWALIRVSNTTPHIKLRFEGKTKDDLHEIAGVLIDILKYASIRIPEVLRSF